jgi:hypothetical protein
LEKSKIVEGVLGMNLLRYFTKNIVVKRSIRPDIRPYRISRMSGKNSIRCVPIKKPSLLFLFFRNYPDSPPECCNLEDPDYLSTPFLCEVSDSLQARLDRMASQYTLSQLLTAWELAVRAACSPAQYKKTFPGLSLGCS